MTKRDFGRSMASSGGCGSSDPGTLADVPTRVACRIESIGEAVLGLTYYAVLGLRRGGFARVLARYPEREPRFVEVELSNQLISLPLSLAAQVHVSAC